MDKNEHEIILVGAGIVGLATARALTAQGHAVIVIEAEQHIASHQTGHNSGVIHSGLYYPPGSEKARTCRQGAESLFAYCAERGIRHERCGKLVVAVSDEELRALDVLERRGNENGLSGMSRLDAAGISRREPNVTGRGALWIPQTGIVDFSAVAAALAEDVRDGGGEVRTQTRLISAREQDDHLRVTTSVGTLPARLLINCAGLQADRVATRCGVDPEVRIIPFRGDYHELIPERRHLIRDLVYPVPDPRFPFLGVHMTRMLDGRVLIGPNAALALSRRGYGRFSCSPRDVLSTLTYPGFWRFARRSWRAGMVEWRRSVSRSAFVRAARHLVPGLKPSDVVRSGAGIRAQAVARTGELVGDFRIKRADRQLHVLNAPSPAATACLAIGESIASSASELLDAS